MEFIERSSFEIKKNSHLTSIDLALKEDKPTTDYDDVTSHE